MTILDALTQEKQERVHAICWRLKKILAEKIGVSEHALYRVDNKSLLSDVMDFKLEFHPWLDVIEIHCMIEETFGCPDDLGLTGGIAYESNSLYEISCGILDKSEKPLIDRIVKQYESWLINIQTEIHDITIDDIKNNGRLLQFAANTMQADKIVVLAALNNYGLALPFATEDLRGDHEVVYTAISNNPLALVYASLPLIADKQFTGNLLTKWNERRMLFKKVCDEVDPNDWLLGESGEWEYFTREWQNAFKYIIRRLQGTAYIRIFFLNAIETWADILQYAPEEIRHDDEIAKKVMDVYPDAIIHMTIKRKDMK